MTRPRKRVEQLGYVEGPKNGSYFLRYWSEPDAAGKRSRETVEIGFKGQFHSKEEAKLSMEAARLRRRINAGAMGRTIGQIAAEFKRDAMPARDNTKATVLSCLQHIIAKWDSEPVAVLAESTEAKRLEGWLDQLCYLNSPGRPLGHDAKQNIRQQMATLFDFAMKRGYIPTNINPMEMVKLVRREAVRRRQKLTQKEIRLFFADQDIPEYVKVIARVAQFTGLRISEITGLKKDDFDLDSCELTVHRRVYRGGIAGPKSVKSGEPVPFLESVYDILSAWLKSPGWYPNFEGWLFCSPVTGRPYSADGMQLRYLHPFGRKMGIEKMGWHTFRHSFKDYLKAAGTPLDEIKRLMRHSKIQTTDGYGSDTDMETLRARQAAAVALMELDVAEPKKRKWA